MEILRIQGTGTAKSKTSQASNAGDLVSSQEVEQVRAMAKKTENKVGNIEATMPFMKKKLNDMEARIDHMEEMAKSRGVSELPTPQEFTPIPEQRLDSGNTKIDEERLHAVITERLQDFKGDVQNMIKRAVKNKVDPEHLDELED